MKQDDVDWIGGIGPMLVVFMGLAMISLLLNRLGVDIGQLFQVIIRELK